jgi:hypothetical protein
MGFTPLEGLVMARRSGSVDPGCCCTCSAQGLSLEQLDRGPAAMGSGLPGPLRPQRRLARAAASRRRAGTAGAQLARAVFLHRLLRKVIGAMAASLGGVDLVGLAIVRWFGVTRSVTYCSADLADVFLEPAGETQQQKAEAAARAVLPAGRETGRLGLKLLGLYNHGGWSGSASANMAAVCGVRREQHGVRHAGDCVRPASCSRPSLPDFEQQLAILRPWLSRLNLERDERQCSARRFCRVVTGSASVG